MASHLINSDANNKHWLKGIKIMGIKIMGIKILL